jgi:CRP/FNR family cyclic AMP-dependent transcriptional regulator
MTTSRSTPPPRRSRLDELRDVGLFGGLDEAALAALVDTLEEVHKAPGDVVFQEGDSGRELFVLVEGEVEVIRHTRRGAETRVALFGPGDWFGEMSIIDVQPRSATLRTISPARLVRMTAHDLDSLYRRDVKSYALVVLNIARELSRRLRVTDHLIAELVANMSMEYRPARQQG